MSEPEKSYTQKLVDSLRMEAETCRACAGHGGESSGDFFAAVALLGRKYDAAAAEIERLASYAKGMEAVAVQHANTVIRLRTAIKGWAQECSECDGTGQKWSGDVSNPDLSPCTDCADIRALLQP